jgi:hypothetical protein
MITQSKLARLQEPSTWAGFAVLLSMFGVHVMPDVIVNAGVAVSGLAAMLLSEKST